MYVCMEWKTLIILYGDTVIPDPIHTRISTTILPTFCIFIFGKMELEAPYF